MNKLWIFADSFGAEPNAAYDFQNRDDWIWWKQAAERMNLHAMPCCDWGVSNEWLYYAMKTEYQNMVPGDKLVLITTDPNRRWFFKDYQSHANLWNREFEKDLGKPKALSSAKKRSGLAQLLSPPLNGRARRRGLHYTLLLGRASRRRGRRGRPLRRSRSQLRRIMK